jgi:CRISPR-associated protein Cmr6
MSPIDNFSLLLHKPSKHQLFKTLTVGKNFKIKKLTERDKEKKEIGRKTELIDNFHFKGNQYNGLWNDLKQRQIDHANLVCEDATQSITLSPDWRLVVGLGNPSVYETSITLHHVYGFPYIPASAIKGVLRNHIINEYFFLTEDENKRVVNPKDLGSEKEKKALRNLGFCRIFGCPKNSARVNKDNEEVAFIGDIIFFDALPITEPNIEMDIMTVHYPKYYGEGTLPPADWQNPVPIPFLTVKDKSKTQKSEFQFIIGLRKGIKNQEITINNELIGNLLDLTQKLLLEALTNKGIGAKTAVGYGYMQS